MACKYGMAHTETMSDYLMFRKILGEYALIGMPNSFTTEQFRQGLIQGEKDFGLEIVTPEKTFMTEFHGAKTEGGHHFYDWDRPLIYLKNLEKKGVLTKKYTDGCFIWTKAKRGENNDSNIDENAK